MDSGSEDGTQIEVDFPAAWFLIPLDSGLVVDPDLHDSTPRHSEEPLGGWGAIGDAVLDAFMRFQPLISDPLALRLDLAASATGLTREQDWIAGTWFCSSEAPQIGVGDDYWVNGRHRVWGLKNAGFTIAPVLLMPFCDAIEYWNPAPGDWPPLDANGVANQHDEFTHWLESPWAGSNPALTARWRVVLGRCDDRIARGGTLH